MLVISPPPSVKGAVVHPVYEFPSCTFFYTLVTLSWFFPDDTFYTVVSSPPFDGLNFSAGKDLNMFSSFGGPLQYGTSQTSRIPLVNVKVHPLVANLLAVGASNTGRAVKPSFF